MAVDERGLPIWLYETEDTPQYVQGWWDRVDPPGYPD